jgi:ABC-type phosphate transport system permease subunit
MTEYINKLRENKFLGLAILDLVGSIGVTSFIGSRLGFDPLLSGLISVPGSVAIHIITGTDTTLTKFYKSDSPHKFHGLIIGTGVGIISKTLIGTSNLTSTNIGLSIGIISTMYMREYGHRLPQKLQRKLLKLYLKYWT